MSPPKKITICASISFWDDIVNWKDKLTKDGYDAIQYPKQLSDDFLSNYNTEFTKHYQQITKSDIVLILNMQKNGVDGYIGAAVFAEIAFAIGLNRTFRAETPIEVYCLNPFPDSLSYAEELQHWVDLEWLKFWQ